MNDVVLRDFTLAEREAFPATLAEFNASPEPWSEKEPRMYSAGYRAGQRLAHVRGALDYAVAHRSRDPYLVGLGVNVYAEGFEDGWHGRVPRLPLRLTDTDWALMEGR